MKKTLSEVHQLLNPHWHETYADASGYAVESTDAASLLCPKRFDLAAKTLLARHIRTGRDLSWAKEVYRAHLDRWSGGKFVESDGSGKVGFDSYLDDFSAICHDFSENGFSSSRSAIPISPGGIIHDGAHRTAAAIDLGISVPTIKNEIEARRYDYLFFRGCGLRDAYSDAMALEFLERSKNSYVAYLFPVDGRDDDRAISHLSDVGEIFYDRELDLPRRGVHNLIAQIYKGEHWLGDAGNGFAGAESHVKNRFIPGQSVRCVFFLADSLDDVVAAKAKIREIYAQGNYPVHINDTHEEVVRVGRQILTANGRHFMKHGRPSRYPRAHRRLEVLRDRIADENRDAHDIMIDSSFVLALYGLRDANDVDYLHDGSPIAGLDDDYQSHNEELAHYPHTLGAMLADPRYFFFYDGVKIASLTLVSEMKARRGEAKDQRDLVLIRGIHQPEKWFSRAGTETQYFFRTLPHRFSKLRLAAFMLIPEGVKPAAKSLYRRMFQRRKPS